MLSGEENPLPIDQSSHALDEKLRQLKESIDKQLKKAKILERRTQRRGGPRRNI